jgi:hypothetical protein
VTETGSRYLVRQDDGGQWWLVADHVPTESSLPIMDAEWQIRAPDPWPPVVGERLWILSQYYEQPGHHARIPGGGKHTSPVVRVEALQEA